MSASVLKRSITIRGHKTSVSLEEPFWAALKEIAAAKHVPMHKLISKIDSERLGRNLSSSIRVFVLQYHSVESKVEYVSDWLKEALSDRIDELAKTTLLEGDERARFI